MNSEELQLLRVESSSGPPISIAYRFRKPKDRQPTFVWFCGFKSEMESVKAEALSAWSREQGAGCLRFDYSGHGQSGGVFEEGTISAWLEQSEAVCDLALSSGPAVFVGSSMGGWIALLIARKLTGDRLAMLTGITMIAPAWDMTRLMWERASEEARTTILRDGVYYRPSAYGDAPYAITRRLIDDGRLHLFNDRPVPPDVPIRILHGCQDPDVPWRHSLDLLDALRSDDVRLTLVKDAGHRLSRPEDLALLFAMLSEYL
jgi:pimeloyl-ACP methyl ester carboxylesterase